MKEGLLALVSAAMEAKNLDETLGTLGYDETPYFNIFSNIADGICKLLGESDVPFEETRTSEALHTPDLTLAQRVKILLGE